LIEFRDIDFLIDCHPETIIGWQQELVPDEDLSSMHNKGLTAVPGWALQMWQNLDACQSLLSQAVQKQQDTATGTCPG
jgi:hypothetical protein